MSITLRRGDARQIGAPGSIPIPSSFACVKVRSTIDEPSTARRTARLVVIGAVTWLLLAGTLWAVGGGSISGTVKDPSGAVIPGASLSLVNMALGSEFHATSDSRGFCSFPTLPVGRYDLRIEARGFETQRRTNLTVDTDVPHPARSRLLGIRVLHGNLVATLRQDRGKQNRDCSFAAASFAITKGNHHTA